MHLRSKCQVEAFAIGRSLDSSSHIGRPVCLSAVDQACTSAMSEEPTPSIPSSGSTGIGGLIFRAKDGGDYYELSVTRTSISLAVLWRCEVQRRVADLHP
jgi:hypothetical protein